MPAVRAPDNDVQCTDAAVVELVGRRLPPASSAEPRPDARRGRRSNLVGNLRDEVSLFLLTVLLAAQVADLWTTHIALARTGLHENNPLFAALIRWLPGVADVIKLGAVGAAVTIAMMVLARPRARGALLLAAGISIVAPISNLLLVAHH